MCRTGGRRCDRSWSETNREVYNTKRRITRTKAAREKHERNGKHHLAEKATARIEADEKLLAELYEHLDPNQQHTDTAAPAAATREALATQWRNTFTDDEREAFDDYGSIAHDDINAKLRGDDTTPLTDDEQQTVAGIMSALQRAPRTDAPHTVHRGLQFRTENAATQFAQQYTIGSTMRLSTPTSTSTSEETAAYFAGVNAEYAKSGVILTINTTQASLMNDSAEKEVLLAPDTEYTVTGRRTETRNGRTIEHITIEETTSPANNTPTALADDTEAAPNSAPTHELANRPSEPTTFQFIRNPQPLGTHTTKGDTTYGQDVEPAGRYMSESAGRTPPGWQSGTVTFNQPLHMDWGPTDGGYDSPDNWKRRLSAHYGNKTGKALSQAVRNDGYDAIITHDRYGTNETVDLTGFSPRRPKK